MTPSSSADQTQALDILFGLAGVFLAVSTATTIVLAMLVRRSFWNKAADAPDAAWRTQLLRLPLGAPEGSVRALLSIYVIVFGLLVLVMQNRLGLANVDAVTGFIGMVIAFYFTSRGEMRASDPAYRAADRAAVTSPPAGTTMQAANDIQPAAAGNRSADATEAPGESSHGRNAGGDGPGGRNTQ